MTSAYALGVFWLGVAFGHISGSKWTEDGQAYQFMLAVTVAVFCFLGGWLLRDRRPVGR